MAVVIHLRPGPEECEKPQVATESQEGEEMAPKLCLCLRRPATDRHHEQPYTLGASNRP